MKVNGIININEVFSIKISMKIIIDNIIFYLQSSGGVSVVWTEIVERLLKEKKIDLKFIEYGVTNNIFRRSLRINDKLILNKNPLFLKVKRYISPIVRFNDKFIFHSTYYRLCKNKNAVNITTVHDFTYEYFFKENLGKKLHCKQKYYAIKKSDYIVCISESTKNDLLKFIPNVDENRIRVIYNGVSNSYKVLKKERLNNLPYSKESYILFVSGRINRKNFSLAVESVALTKYNFVIVGPPLTINERKLLDSKLLGRYTLLQNLNNEELNVIYNYAYCLLYPSSYEGFGIPVIEAQKAGCPVIAYNASSIPEIIGNTPLLMNELSSKEILNKLNKLSENGERESIIKNGLINSSRFSWDKTYDQYLSLYKEIFSFK